MSRALFGGLGPDWQMQQVATPEPGPGQALVKVEAAGLNRADLDMLAGRYSPASKTGAAYPAGLEFAGVVAGVGSGVGRWGTGDRVMGSTLGAFATHVLVDYRHLVPAPPGLTWQQAAALPVAVATEYDALINRAHLTKGQSVLVVGATSGVGLVGVQLARILGAGLVVGTTTSAPKALTLSAVGCDVVVDTSRQDLAEAVGEATGGVGVDVVVDHVGGDLFGHLPAATCVGGAIVNVGRLGGTTATIDLDQLSFRRLQIVGTTFSVRTPDELAQVCAAVERDVLPSIEAGTLRPVVDKVFPLERATEAAEYVRSNQALGKVVLAVA